MLTDIVTSFAAHPSFDRIRRTIHEGRPVNVHGLGGSSSAFAAAVLARAGGEDTAPPLLVVLPGADEAESFRSDLAEIVGPDAVRLFPERDTTPYEFADSHFEIRSLRVETLDALERGFSGIVVAAVGALHDPTTPPGLIGLTSFVVSTGEQLEFQEFVRTLVAHGFKRVNTVSASGQVAVRGGIVDVFPFGCETPFRVEFWGDTIESLRTFSLATQRSTGSVDAIRVIPPDEFVTEAGMNAADELRLENAERVAGIDLGRIRGAFAGGDRPNGIEQYLNVVFGERTLLTAHFPRNALVLVSDPAHCAETVESRIQHARTIWEHQRADDPDLPPPELLYQSPDALMDALTSFARVDNHTLRPHGVEVIEFAVQSSRHYRGNSTELSQDIREAAREGMRTIVLCDNAGQETRLRDILDDADGDYTSAVSRLSAGFTDRATGIMVLTDHEIFNRRVRRAGYRRFKESAPIDDYRALMLGDFVVHVDYGIGRYTGLRRAKIGGAETDCLVVRYRDNDELLVPVAQLGRLKKYTAEEGVVPVVTKLGGTAWDKLKDRTKKSIERLARDLLKLYAERKAYPGFACNVDDPMMRQFVDSFVYEATPDQERAWMEVLADMGSASPMERLICGDVGFGKTEIGMRAACLSVLNGRQVAVLVPTTILCEQHEDTFKERFADFPVIIESISRFKTAREQKDVLERVARNEVDILIGTHRLLSKDIHVTNIGLLLIDEEQRFGVRHKERLKNMRSAIDVLSMSATPIPRTLNMSLLGARDISYINTPPVDRLSVHTEIVQFDEKLVIDAIMREIERDGQVFFVHNRVRSILAMAEYLRRLMPSVTFCVAHGQLPEKQLERIMHDFHQGKYQVLITTMIIENGLDIPAANTIIINRADTFGLSQLYQLRGRVGRSSRRAFAYMLVPPQKQLTKIAHQRLRTIEEFAELGSGFKIAMRDLEIRGAGNILGTEQSGFITAIGFDLYIELLNETVAELRGEKMQRPPDVEVRLPEDAYFPAEYIADTADRVLVYRRLSETLTIEDVRAIDEELVDRFGKPGRQAANVLNAAYIRHHAAAIGVSEVIISGNEAKLRLSESIEPTRELVERLVAKAGVKLNFSFAEGMEVQFSPSGDDEDPVAVVKNTLQAMCS